jgi:hypothetical protein
VFYFSSNFSLIVFGSNSRYYKTGGLCPSENHALRKDKSMTKQIGLWIDHKRAVVVILSDDGESMQIIESGVGRHIHYRGATHPRTPYSAQYQKGDDQLDKQFENHLNQYYEKVLIYFRGADAVLIFGPGEAKHELKRRLEHQKNHIPIEDIESADKMTDRQITAKVRNYFEKVHVKG